MRGATRCRNCGILKPHFATGWSAERTFKYEDSGSCMSCRHGGTTYGRSVKPGDVRGLKALLAEMNRRKPKKEVTV